MSELQEIGRQAEIREGDDKGLVGGDVCNSGEFASRGKEKQVSKLVPGQNGGVFRISGVIFKPLPSERVPCDPTMQPE